MKLQEPLISYILHLADNALILGHRNSEWTGHGPILEQDIALSNIALDLIGQSRNFYQYAALLAGDGSTEDSLAYLRDARAYRNCLLVEQPNGDWGQTITRQFFFSTYQYYLYRDLSASDNEQLAAIAKKSFKESAYHLRWSAEWMIRLGDGTSESNARMQKAVDRLWPFLGELYLPSAYEQSLVIDAVIPCKDNLQELVLSKVKTIMAEATLTLPNDQYMQTGGKNGLHSEHLGYLLAEMQFLQRAYPGSNW